MKIENKDDIRKLIENNEIEIKKATHTFPKDAFETYSAFANTNGGYLILGVTELDDYQFELTGVENSKKIIKEMFDSLHNKKVVSKNLLTDSNVKCKIIDNKEVIIIYVPVADYRNKPVYINNNIYNTYYRSNSSDYKCDKEMVDSMIRDSVPISYDSNIVENFTINDLDSETITKYRNLYRNVKPTHPYNNCSDEEFLVKIGAMVPDRNKTNVISPTVAGLLIFGKSSSICEKLPHYHIEYIDKIDVGLKYERWRDRVINDGSWGEANLYNFFFTVINKLYLTLKNSFVLNDDSIGRKEDTPMRTAIREAFVNSIIHNDFQNTKGIIAIRLNDSFEFKNGGTLRISKEKFFMGGFSEPRNHNIQKIFNFVNLSERAGSGIPKVVDAVKKYNLIFPKLDTFPDFIIFKLYDVSIVENASELNDIEKSVFGYIVDQKFVKRLDIDKEFLLTKIESLKILNILVEKGYIEKIGNSVATTYKICNSHKMSSEYELYDSLLNFQNEVRKLLK